MNIETVKEKLKKNPLHFTNNVLLETTNRCNYASIHPRCPLHKITDRRILPLKIIEKILIELGKYNFSGTFYPFNYSEPLIDPRFYNILSLAKKYIPNAKIWIYSNGFMVDKNLLEELDERGLDRINFSAYTEVDNIYLHNLIKSNRDKLKMELRAYKRYPMNERMNNKVDWYDNEKINLKIPCPSPLRFITINSVGEVVLCCHDWKSKEVFGSLVDNTLYKIVNSDKSINTFVELSNGEREKYELCSRCNKHR